MGKNNYFKALIRNFNYFLSDLIVENPKAQSMKTENAKDQVFGLILESNPSLFPNRKC
jgi:hypothetical protein